jgi:hypothetical protein
MLVFSRGQKKLRFKFSAFFDQLSLNMLGRQQRLILLFEKDQQVLQMGKTITIAKINICIYICIERLRYTSQNCSAEQSLFCCSVSLLQCLLFFDTFCPLEKN